MRILVAAAGLILGCLELSSGRPLVVGTMDDTFHQAESAVVAHVLKRRCFDVQFQILTHSESFKALLNGSIDILPSVWLPSGHASYFADAVKGRDYEILGTTSEEGVFFWVVSEALSATVKSLEDLADPSKTEGMLSRIHGPTPDSGLSKASINITAELNRRRAEVNKSAPLFEYVPDFAAMLEFLENPVGVKYACAFWVPNWLVASYLVPGQVVRIAGGDLGAAFGLPNRGVTVVNGDFQRSGIMDAETVSALSRIFVGNTAVSAMDLEMRQTGAGPMEVAAEMMARPEYTYWYDTSSPCPQGAIV